MKEESCPRIVVLLLGLLRERPPLASSMLESRGIGLESLHEHMEAWLDEG